MSKHIFNKEKLLTLTNKDFRKHFKCVQDFYARIKFNKIILQDCMFKLRIRYFELKSEIKV